MWRESVSFALNSYILCGQNKNNSYTLCYQELEEQSEWRNSWQSQLSELKRRSMNRDARGNMSWGARMRRQRDESSKEQ